MLDLMSAMNNRELGRCGAAYSWGIVAVAQEVAHEPAARVALEADLEGWGGYDRLNWKSMALETVSIC